MSALTSHRVAAHAIVLLLLLAVGAAFAQTSSTNPFDIAYTPGSGSIDASSVTSTDTSMSTSTDSSSTSSTSGPSGGSSAGAGTTYLLCVLRVLGPESVLSGSSDDGNAYTPPERVVLALNNVTSVPWAYQDQQESVGSTYPDVPASVQGGSRRRLLLAGAALRLGKPSAVISSAAANRRSLRAQPNNGSDPTNPCRLTTHFAVSGYADCSSKCKDKQASVPGSTIHISTYTVSTNQGAVTCCNCNLKRAGAVTSPSSSSDTSTLSASSTDSSNPFATVGSGSSGGSGSSTTSSGSGSGSTTITSPSPTTTSSGSGSSSSNTLSGSGIGGTYVVTGSVPSGVNGVVVFARSLFPLSSGQAAAVATNLKTATLSGKLQSAMQQFEVPGPPSQAQVLYVGQGPITWPDGSQAQVSSTDGSPPSPPAPPAPDASPASTTQTTVANTASTSSGTTSAPPSSSSNDSGGGSNTALIIAISVGVGALVLVILFVVVVIVWKRRRQQFKSSTLDGQALVARWQLERELGLAERARLDRDRRAKSYKAMGLKPLPSMQAQQQWPPEPPQRSKLDAFRSKLGLGGKDHLAKAAAAVEAEEVAPQGEAAAAAGVSPATPQPSAAPPAGQQQDSPPLSVASARSTSSAPDAPMLADTPESSAPVARELDGRRGGWASREASERRIFGNWRK